MKKTNRTLALLSSIARYSIIRRKDRPEAMKRIGKRIGSKIPVVFSLDRSLVGRSQDSWGGVICTKILPLFGISGATHGRSKHSQRVVVKIQKSWETRDQQLYLPIIPWVIERIFEGWSIPISIEIQVDKSILFAISERTLLD